MRAWLILAFYLKTDPKFGRVRYSLLWDARLNEWSEAEGAAYRTREEAEEKAIFLAALTAPWGWSVSVMSFEEVMRYYGLAMIDGEGEDATFTLIPLA